MSDQASRRISCPDCDDTGFDPKRRCRGMLCAWPYDCDSCAPCRTCKVRITDQPEGADHE